MNFMPLILLAVCFICGIPVAYSLIIAVIPYFLQMAATMPTDIIVQRLVANSGSFPLLAIPFFILSGVIMNRAGITQRLMVLADCLVGHLTGGLGQVNVLLSAMSGGMSGSCAADAATQCKILVPEMTKRGYDISFSAAVTAASSLITPIIPPGIALVMYAYLVDVSVGKMFMAGYVPGILTTVLMMLLVYWISKKRHYKGSRTKRASAQELWQATRQGIWGLFIPFGILIGLRMGLFSPTEAGALCCLYSLIIGLFVYRTIKLKDLWSMIWEAVLGTCTVLFLMAAANVFAYYLSWERIPHEFSKLLVDATDNPFVFLIIVNVVFLVLGMFLEGGASMVILAPILAPVAASLGIDMIHFGIVMVFNITIGCITPPFGIILYLVSPLLKINVRELMRAIWPFIGVFIIVLMIITFCPTITTWIPNLVFGR